MSEPNLLGDVRRRLRQATFEWRDKHEPLRASWDLETVKHLAIVNGAGFAGTATVVASNLVGSNRHPGLFVLFGLGLLCAIANMYLGSLGYGSFMEELTRRVKSFDEDETDDGRRLFDGRSGLSLFIMRMGMLAGWLSAGLAVLGGIGLARAVS